MPLILQAFYEAAKEDVMSNTICQKNRLLRMASSGQDNVAFMAFILSLSGRENRKIENKTFCSVRDDGYIAYMSAFCRSIVTA